MQVLNFLDNCVVAVVAEVAALLITVFVIVNLIDCFDYYYAAYHSHRLEDCYVFDSVLVVGTTDCIDSLFL